MKSYRNIRGPITTIEVPLSVAKYGYRINVGHKVIASLFHEWKIANKLSTRWPTSDADRLRFENFVLDAIATYQQNVEDYLKYQLDYLKQKNKLRTSKEEKANE